MPLGSALNSFRLLLSNLDSEKQTNNQLVKKNKPDKPLVFPYGSEINSLERGEPEKYGYSKEYIQSFLMSLIVISRLEKIVY